MADNEKFNPLNPKQAAPSGSFAAKRAAREARANNQDANDALVNIGELSDADRYQIVKNSNIAKAASEFRFSKPEDAKEAVAIIFDDSSSMSSHNKIKDAIEGVTEFMRDCIPNETAVKIYPLNAHDNAVLDYSCNLPAHATDVALYRAVGGTPLYSAIQANLNTTPIKPKRLIVFSDGEPQGRLNGLNETIAAINEAKINCDTCLIADPGFDKETSIEYQIMKRLAEETGGIFIVFERGKCSFKHGFKYLTKGNRLLLADASFKAALEQGRV